MVFFEENNDIIGNFRFSLFFFCKKSEIFSEKTNGKCQRFLNIFSYLDNS